MLQSVFELPDVLGSVGEEHSISMNSVVEPLAQILHSIVVFHFVGLYFGKEVTLGLGNRAVLVVRQCQAVIEGEIQLLQFRPYLFGSLSER